jgi:hypothetical protein
MKSNTGQEIGFRLWDGKWKYITVQKNTYKNSQTCAQWPLLGPEKRGRYAEGCLKKISGT